MARLLWYLVGSSLSLINQRKRIVVKVGQLLTKLPGFAHATHKHKYKSESDIFLLLFVNIVKMAICQRNNFTQCECFLLN